MSSGRDRRVPAVLVALVLVVVGACGGDDQDGASPGARPASTFPTSTTPTPSTAPPTRPPDDASLPVDRRVPAPAPVSVAVPDIGVESSLLHLGLRPDGSAEVPDEFALASWYRHGGRPGGHGPTVVLGHVDSTDGPAVFARLRELAPGDRIEITLEDGTVAIYAMTGSIEFHKDAVPTREVFGATVDDVLRLITCSGPFDRAASSYTENLVVNAERVGTRSAP